MYASQYLRNKPSESQKTPSKRRREEIIDSFKKLLPNIQPNRDDSEYDYDLDKPQLTYEQKSPFVLNYIATPNFTQIIQREAEEDVIRSSEEVIKSDEEDEVTLNPKRYKTDDDSEIEKFPANTSNLEDEDDFNCLSDTEDFIDPPTSVFIVMFKSPLMKRKKTPSWFAFNSRTIANVFVNWMTEEEHLKYHINTEEIKQANDKGAIYTEEWVKCLNDLTKITHEWAYSSYNEDEMDKYYREPDIPKCCISTKSYLKEHFGYANLSEGITKYPIVLPKSSLTTDCLIKNCGTIADITEVKIPKSYAKAPKAVLYAVIKITKTYQGSKTICSDYKVMHSYPVSGQAGPKEEPLIKESAVAYRNLLNNKYIAKECKRKQGGTISVFNNSNLVITKNVSFKVKRMVLNNSYVNFSSISSDSGLFAGLRNKNT